MHTLLLRVLVVLNCPTLLSRNSYYYKQTSFLQYFGTMQGTKEPPKPSGVKRVMLFGGSGMIGQGVLRECIKDEGVQEILAVGRTPTGQTSPKLQELQHQDFLNFTPLEERMRGVDACFWCLGASSSAVNNEQFKLINKDYPLAAANLLSSLNPNMTFIYVSGIGSDSSSSTHWARIKGEAEDELLKLGFNAYNFRIGITRPMHGEQTKVRLHRYLGFFLKPLIPIVQHFSNQVATTEGVGQAMLEVARNGFEKRYLTVPDINSIASKVGTK